MRYDAIVVGVGGLGAAVLDHLAGRGLRVLGLERAAMVPHDRSSSHGRTRVIRKAYFEDPRYVPLLERAYTLWDELASESGVALLRRTGCVNVGPRVHPCIEGVLSSVARHGLAHEILDAGELARRFPIVPGDEDIGVFEADGGALAVEACTAAHLARARRRGASVELGVEVAALDPVQASVTLADGTVRSAGHLVVTAGAWLPTLLPLPVVVERQVQLWFEPVADVSRLPAFIHFTPAGNFYGIPGADGRAPVKVCQHHGGSVTTASELDRRVVPADEARVRAHIQAHLPGVDGRRVDAEVCMYANTPDDHFLVGPVPGAPRTLVVGGGSGHAFKMASVLGEIGAQLVCDGRSSLDIALFALDRPSLRPSG